MKQEELDFIQVNYSLEQRESAERLLPLAADSGVAVMINRAFGGGRIFDKVGDQALPDWAQEFDSHSWAQFLLKYAVSHPAATVAIPSPPRIRKKAKLPQLCHMTPTTIRLSQQRLPARRR